MAVVKALVIEEPYCVDEVIYTFASFMTHKYPELPNGYAVQEWIDINGGWVSDDKILHLVLIL